MASPKEELDYAKENYQALVNSLPDMKANLALLQPGSHTGASGLRPRRVLERHEKARQLRNTIEAIESGRFKARFDEMCESLAHQLDNVPAAEDEEISADPSIDSSQDDVPMTPVHSETAAESKKSAADIVSDIFSKLPGLDGTSEQTRIPSVAESLRRKKLLSESNSRNRKCREAQLTRECAALFRQSAQAAFIPASDKAEKDTCLDCKEPFIFAEDDARKWCPKCEKSQGYFESTFNPFHSTNTANPTASGMSAPSVSSSNNAEYGQQLSTLETNLSAFRERPTLYIPHHSLDLIRRRILENRTKGTKGLMPTIGQQIAPATVKEIELCVKKHADLKQYAGNELQISEFLNNDRRPTLTEAQINTIKQLAKKFYPVFGARFPGQPSLEYRFLIEKFCSVAGFNQFNQLDPLVKFSKPAGRLEKQWQEVCKILNW